MGPAAVSWACQAESYGWRPPRLIVRSNWNLMPEPMRLTAVVSRRSAVIVRAFRLSGIHPLNAVQPRNPVGVGYRFDFVLKQFIDH